MRTPLGRHSLRARLMVIGVTGVALALFAGAVALYAVLHVVSYRNLDRIATATADEVGQLVARQRLPDPIPVTGAQVVQVVDTRDRVVSASANADRLTSMLPGRELAVARKHPVAIDGSRAGLDSPLRVTAVAVRSPDGVRTVIVGQQFEDLVRTTRLLRTTLLISYPLLLVVLALIAWRVIGAALRPVEALRSTAEQISGSGQDERLPVPASADEIHALAVTLNSMLDRLAASRARQQSFAADVAHELRSPLTSMRTQLEVAARLGEGRSDDLLDEVVRMSSLVDDLLVLVRLDAAASPVGATALPVGQLLEEVAGRYATARVPVRVLGAGDGVVTWDRGELSRVIGNLADNAVRHARTRVDLSSTRTGGRVVLRVEDDGPGIAPDDRERVFERFTRLDAARDRDAGGSGLGLAIVRELVRRRGGEVLLGVSGSGGLRADVRLPAAADRDSTEA